MIFLFIKKYRFTFRVSKMCRVFNVSRSGFYKWLGSGAGKRKIQNNELLALIRKEHEKSDKTYGSLRITHALRNQGNLVGKNRVARIMRERGIIGIRKRSFKITTNSKHKLGVSPNLLEGGVKPLKANTIWVSDVTYVRTAEGWLYHAVILDLWSRNIVGSNTSKRLKADLVGLALKDAIRKRKPEPGLILHSDRGVQYASKEFRDILKVNGILQSMSGKGNCYDNAYAESFFKTLKTELIYRRAFQTREEARLAIFEYIEIFYNRQRLHSALGYRCPVEYELYAKVA